MKRCILKRFLIAGFVFFLQCNEKPEITIDKVKITFQAQHKIQGNILALTGNVSIVNNTQNKEFSIGLTYSDVVKVPKMHMAAHEYVKTKVKKSFDFSHQFTLKKGKTYWARLFAYDEKSKATVYGDVFKIIVSNNMSITLTKPQKDATGILQKPTLEWSSNAVKKVFDVFLKKESETNFTKIGDGVSSPFSLTNSLEKNQRYYWYVVHKDTGAKSATSNFFTQTLPKLDLYSGKILAYTQDAMGNQYLVLQKSDYGSYDFTFQGKTYASRISFLIKKSPTGTILKVKKLEDVSVGAIWRDKYLYFSNLYIDTSGFLYLNVSGAGGFKYETTSINTIIGNNPSSTVLKINKDDLNLVWKKTIKAKNYAGPNGGAREGFQGGADYIQFSANERGESVLAIKFTKLEAAGQEISSKGGKDIFLIKYDASGNVVYKHSFGTTEDDDLLAVNIGKQGKVVLGVHFGGSNKFIYKNNVKTTTKTRTLIASDPKYCILLYFNTQGTALYGSSLSGWRKGTLLSLATNSSSELFELYRVDKQVTISIPGQRIPLPPNSVYYVKHSKNTTAGIFQGFKHFLTGVARKPKLKLSVSSDVPYIHGASDRIVGGGINYTAPNNKRTPLVAMQINANSLDVVWLKTTEDSRVNTDGYDGMAKGVFQNTRGIWIYGSTHPQAKIDGNALSYGLIYKK